MSNYMQVSAALTRGVQPKDLCVSCPWDRFCIEPPAMTPQDVQAQIDQAAANTHLEKPESALMGTILTSMIFAGRDSAGEMCPVLVVRLRGSEGRSLVDAVRKIMKGWDDEVIL